MFRLYRRLWPWGVAAVAIPAAIAAALTQANPATIERWYSLRMYPFIERALTSATNLVPFAVLDLVILVSVVWAIRVIVVAVRRARQTRALAPLGRAVVEFATAGAVVYLLFLALWGLNYRRVAMVDRLTLEPAAAQTDRVMPLGLEAVRQLNSLHAEAHRIGWADAERRDGPLAAAAARVQHELTGARPAVPGRLKSSMLGLYFRWSGVDGMVNPFGLDVIGNPDLLPLERPFVAAHEWAHLAGFADESEASFVGFLTCVRASVPDQYSGWLFLYWQIAGETDATSRSRLWDAMEAGPRADVEAVGARLRRGQLPRLRVVSWLVYDQYLKANRVESGVRSYGEVVNLLVRARFEAGWRAVRKPVS